MQENKSEVARIREQIERECQAMKFALEGPAIVASHQSINARYDNLNIHKRQLASLIGEDEATRVLYETYTQVVG